MNYCFDKVSLDDIVRLMAELMQMDVVPSVEGWEDITDEVFKKKG